MNELNTRCTKAECGSPIKIPKLELQQQDSHKHAPEKAFQIGQNSAGPPASDNVLKYRTAENGSGDDAYKLTIQAGITYRLQLINTSVDSDLRVHLDNHPFSVIGTDFVPLVPNITSYIQIGIGEQLDVVFTAN
ncbi:hypothetical protein IAQ61_006446 [Plenodomus lingam]|uniref:uncharacterized protein n=1 Tax=Leptosphaeria maculans TaxID=5022 RepID=UPI0033270F0C|nr:hypothetical protein IAQ61_006446 [Plenodomus lingam]